MATKKFSNTKLLTHTAIRSIQNIAQSIADLCDESLKNDICHYDAILSAIETIYPQSKKLAEESAIQRYLNFKTKEV